MIHAIFVSPMNRVLVYIRGLWIKKRAWPKPKRCRANTLNRPTPHVKSREIINSITRFSRDDQGSETNQATQEQRGPETNQDHRGPGTTQYPGRPRIWDQPGPRKFQDPEQPRTRELPGPDPLGEHWIKLLYSIRKWSTHWKLWVSITLYKFYIFNNKF